MVQRDVILTVFAASEQAPTTKWADQYFNDPPIVLNCPGGGGSEFRQHVINWGRTGDVFNAALQQLRPDLTDVQIRRRGLVTFSVGWAAGEELLRIPAELERLDAYLLLDGCATLDLKNWVDFAKRAAELKAMMVMAHSSIVPPSFPSTTKTNTEIFNQAKQAIQNDAEVPLVETELPDYLLHAQLPQGGHTIALPRAGTLPSVSKHWNEDPLIESESIGELVRLHYSGNDRPDHCYIAWYVAEPVWRFLGEGWSGSA